MVKLKQSPILVLSLFALLSVNSCSKVIPGQLPIKSPEFFATAGEILLAEKINENKFIENRVIDNKGYDNRVNEAIQGEKNKPDSVFRKISDKNESNIIFSCKGQNNKASLSVKLKFSTRGFKLQAKTIENDLQSLKFCLLESDTGVSPAVGINVVAVSEMFTFNTSGSTANLIFTNIVANHPGKSYYIAVAAFDELDGNGNNITNNTGNNGDNNRVTIAGEQGNFYVSSGGGDTTGTNSGSVSITPVTYEVSSFLPLVINLKLLD